VQLRWGLFILVPFAVSLFLLAGSQVVFLSQSLHRDLPYGPARLGSKAAREIEALDCERGTRWEALLAPPALPHEADTPRRDDREPTDWDALLA